MDNIKGMVYLLDKEKNDMPEVYYHSLNVADLTLFICKKLNYNKDLMKVIYRGALLHDVGKLEIPQDILFKKDPLTDIERGMICSHTLLGYEILKQYTNSKIILNIAKYHHEKMDGSGYPCKLNDISEYIQIVTICDMFDALTNKRCYKNPYSFNESFNILDDEANHYKINSKLLKILKAV